MNNSLRTYHDCSGNIQDGNNRRPDLLVMDGDPLEDVTILAEPEKRLRLVIKDGL